MDDLGAGHRRREVADEPGAGDGDVGDPRLVLAEDDAALQGRGRIVKMDDDAPGAADRLEAALDKLGARLRQDLDGDVIRDELLLDELADEVELGLRRRRESDLDLLEAHLHQEVEHAALALGPHRLHQRLIAVAQIDAAPDRRALDDPRRPLPVGQCDGSEGSVFVDGHAVHGTGLLANGKGWRSNGPPRDQPRRPALSRRPIGRRAPRERGEQQAVMAAGMVQNSRKTGKTAERPTLLRASGR
jgi:hypothetical protein